LGFEFVNRVAARFILRTGGAGSKGSGHPAKRDGRIAVGLSFLVLCFAVAGARHVADPPQQDRALSFDFETFAMSGGVE
jgi:hypothetical protein